MALKPPAGWTAGAIGSRQVPGIPVQAWRGPGGSSMVVYTTLPAPGGDASAHAVALATRLENLPGLSVLSRGVTRVGGRDAARVDVVGQGTGDSLAPTGLGTPVAPGGQALVPTRAVHIAFLRPADTLCLVWHCPEARSAGLSADLDAFLDSMRVDFGRLTTSSY